MKDYRSDRTWKQVFYLSDKQNLYYFEDKEEYMDHEDGEAYQAEYVRYAFACGFLDRSKHRVAVGVAQEHEVLVEDGVYDIHDPHKDTRFEDS